MNQTELDNATQAVQQIIGYTFTNSQLLRDALQTSGSTFVDSHGNQNTNDVGNARLAVLGDAWARVVIVDAWYHSDADRGKVELKQRGQKLQLTN